MNQYKKTLCLFIAILTAQFSVMAQQSRMSYKLMQLVQHESNSQKSIAVLIKGNVPYIKEEVVRLGGHFKYAAGNIAAVNLPVEALKTLADDPNIQRMEEGRLELEPMNDRMLINNKIDKVHSGVSPLTQGYDGEGVIVGIIDSGIDFTHPDFKDSLGNTRVLWIWDHLLPNAANTPSLYGYGQEFSAADINAGNASAHVDGLAHGTHVSGIATSNGRSHVEYTGAAPKADIIAVSLDFNIADDQWLSSVADAVNYIYDKADSAGKPCVINISAGTYFGSHDGKDLSALAIDYLITAKAGRSLAAACGNAGGNPIHVQHTPSNDTLFTWFSKPGATANNGIYIELWADTANLKNVKFTIGADQITPLYEDRGQLNWMSVIPNLNVLRQDTLKSISGNRIGLVQRVSQLIGSSYSMIYYILPDSANYFYRLMSKGTGKFDVWSFDMVTSPLPAPSAYPNITRYVLPDLNQTVCSSFQCSDKVITVGQYVNRNSYMDVNGNLQTFPTTVGQQSVTSSKGPTRDGRIKPDIMSTGEVTLSALRLSSVAFFLANQPYKLAPDSIHIRDGGTSSAAPVVAGVGALYFQKNPTATWNDYKTRVKLCAVQDAFTGSVPNNDYGYGKLDALAVMVGCNALGINEHTTKTLIAFPNPSNDKITLTFPPYDNIAKLELYNAIGEKLRSIIISSSQDKIEIVKEKLPAGLYLISFNCDGKNYSKRIVFE